MKSALSLLLAAVLSSSLLAPAMAEEAKAPAKPDAKKGEAIATAVCGACHTADGSRGSPANPILQGQHPEYLAKQLAEFKSGKRNNAIMKAFATALSEDDMRNVAAYYSAKQAKPGFAKNQASATLGQQIYRGGIADKQVPACAGCHSPDGVGIPAQYPRLAGQHADYTEAQLVAFRGGVRNNNAQMTTIASKLSDTEIKALSDYISGLR